MSLPPMLYYYYYVYIHCAKDYNANYVLCLLRLCYACSACQEYR